MIPILNKQPEKSEKNVQIIKIFYKKIRIYETVSSLIIKLTLISKTNMLTRKVGYGMLGKWPVKLSTRSMLIDQTLLTITF